MWALRCSRVEMSIATMDIAAAKTVLSEAQVRYNGALLRSLACCNKLEKLGVAHEEMGL
jgi:hypothetical protein